MSRTSFTELHCYQPSTRKPTQFNVKTCLSRCQNSVHTTLSRKPRYEEHNVFHTCGHGCSSHSFQIRQENLDWADLITIDLSLYSTPEGKKELAQTLIKAVREDGFFYVKNFNISQEHVNRQFSIGKHFYDLPVEEKLKYVPEGLGTYAITLCG